MNDRIEERALRSSGSRRRRQSLVRDHACWWGGCARGGFLPQPDATGSDYHRDAFRRRDRVRSRPTDQVGDSSFSLPKGRSSGQ